MNAQDLRSLLADRAESVDTHRPDRVGEVHGRIRTARRRRRATVAGAAFVVAALAVAAVTLPDTSTKTQEPVDKPTRSISTLHTDSPSNDVTVPPLDAGTYVVDVDGLRPHPVVDVPPGFKFSTSGPELAKFGRFVDRQPGDDTELGFWNGDKIIVVHPERCGGPLRRPGPGVDNLAIALADLPNFRAADPAPVSLGGHDGLYVELVKRQRLPGDLGQRQVLESGLPRAGTRARRAPVDPRRRRQPPRGPGLPRAGRHRRTGRRAHPHGRVSHVRRNRVDQGRICATRAPRGRVRWLTRSNGSP